MNPSVSIIMPCRNGEKYLADSIQSVLSQSYTDWELLVVDDCSQDASVAIIKRFCVLDHRITLLQTEAATGAPAHPRNMGIRHAHGRFIAFLDCDDVWLSTKLETQLPLFDSSNVAVVFSCYEKMNQKGSRNNRIITAPEQVSYSLLLKGNCIGNLTGIYDTHKIGKIEQKGIHHEDYVMWLDILRTGFIAKNTNTCEAIYREQRKSVSGNKFLTFPWQWNVYRNELKLSMVSSIYYFMFYAVKAVKKFLI